MKDFLRSDKTFDEEFESEIDKTLQKYKDVSFSQDERTLFKSRITDYLIKLYGKFDDEDWQRVNDDRCGELQNLLLKTIKREKFFEENRAKKQEKERFLIITELNLENWHVYPKLNINLESGLNSELINNGTFKSFNPNYNNNGNVIVFIARNSEGKSGIFKGFKMGLLGPDKFFLSSLAKNERDEKILELVNKKAINQAIKNKTEHIKMKISVSFRLRKDSAGNWTDYKIIHTWKIKVDLNGDLHKIYNYEAKYQRLNALGVGIHKDLDSEVFQNRLKMYIPETLQNLFITNKTVLTRSLIEEGANFIQATSLKSSDFFILEVLSKTVWKLQKFVEKNEKDWLLNNITGNKDRLKTLENNISQIESDLKRKKDEKVKTTKKIRQIDGDFDNLKEQAKDCHQEDLDKYIALKTEADKINTEIRKLLKSTNQTISKVFLNKLLSNLYSKIDPDDFSNKIADASKNLPKIPEETDFSGFNDYLKIVSLILKKNKNLCGLPLSDEARSFFETEMLKDEIEVYHFILENCQKSLKTKLTIKDADIETIKENSINLSNLRNDYNKKLILIKRSKPRKSQKDIDKILKNIDRFEKTKKDLQAKERKLEKEIKQLSIDLRDNKEKFEDLKDQLDQPDLIAEKKRFSKQKLYLEIMQTYIEKTKEKYEKKLQNDVQLLITNYFKDIDWEGKFWDGFKIDDDWSIKFVDKNNHTITLPSDGQNKIIMISFICSLIELHRYKIPWIMDNVLSEISDLNIQGFAKQIVSNTEFPQQMFFFSITEWGDIKKYLNSGIIQAFGFNKVSAVESKVIEIKKWEDMEFESE